MRRKPDRIGSGPDAMDETHRALGPKLDDELTPREMMTHLTAALVTRIDASFIKARPDPKVASSSARQRPARRPSS